MNNIAKFNETKKALINFQKQTNYLQQEAEKKIESEGPRLKDSLEVSLRGIQTKELAIDKKKNLIIFESTTLGYYKQFIFKNKRRINAIPLCFLVELYKENLRVKEIPDMEKINDIPFTLRGFWNMENTVKFISDLMSVQIDAATIIQKQMRVNRKNERRVKELKKILQVVESLEIFVINNPKKQLYEIHFEQNIFKVNKKNRKIDVVPLCKILTEYYVRIINYIENYQKLLGITEDKEDVCKIKSSFKNLMDKYFTLHILRYID